MITGVEANSEVPGLIADSWNAHTDASPLILTRLSYAPLAPRGFSHYHLLRQLEDTCGFSPFCRPAALRSKVAKQGGSKGGGNYSPLLFTSSLVTQPTTTPPDDSPVVPLIWLSTSSSPIFVGLCFHLLTTVDDTYCNF